MKIVIRILKEFSIPFLVAGAWTLYNVHNQSKFEMIQITKDFGSGFFFVSWLTGQFFRIKKQVGTDENLTEIERRISTVLQTLEGHMKDFMGFATGRGSHVYFLPALINPGLLSLDLYNPSPYPAFDIKIELVDLDDEVDIENGKFPARHKAEVESLYKNKFVEHVYMLNVSDRDRFAFNVFIRTRDGEVVQEFRGARVADRFTIANRVRIGLEVIMVLIPENYPGYDASKPDRVFDWHPKAN